VPGLLGLPRDYLAGQLGAWKTGQRRAASPDCMAQLVNRLGPDDISAVTHWLASRPVPADAKPAKAFPGPLPAACGGVAEAAR
jgi:cytochrome c553